MSGRYEGRWLAYRPLCFNRYTRVEYAGRLTKAHLVAEEQEERATFACGKDVLWFDMWEEDVYDNPRETHIGKNGLRHYCKACLKTVGIDKPRNRSRDHQRKRVYRAEWALYGMSDFSAASVAEASEYANMVFSSDEVRAAFGPRLDQTLGGQPRPVHVRARKGNQGRGHADGREIALGRRAMDEYTILHELAHTIHRRLKSRAHIWARDPNLDHSGHGRVYVGILLRLIDDCLGADKGERLRASLRKTGAKWDEWNDPIITD